MRIRPRPIARATRSETRSGFREPTLHSRQGLTVDPYGQPTGRYAPYYPGASRGAPYGYGAYPADPDY